MSHAETKTQRLDAIQSLLLTHSEGFTQAEIAKKLGVHRSTIGRYLVDLPPYIYIDENNKGKWKIDRQADIIRIYLNIHETTALHLATRLLATRMDKQNPHAASALQKLSLAIERVAPHISHHMKNSANTMIVDSQMSSPAYVDNLEKLTVAWAESRKAKVWHSRGKNHHLREYIFSPYFIEPYAIGQTTFVIGYCEPQNALRNLKIERIKKVELTNELYVIPDKFDAQELLSDAWGIWFTNREPKQVILKFFPKVASRVQESRWHHSEEVELLQDGCLLWKAYIAEPTEMLPWIRGWGGDCEVLEPESLREALVKEVKILTSLYGVQQ